MRELITNDYKYKRIMIESREEFNHLLSRLNEKETLNKLGKSLQIKLQAFKEVEDLINGLNNLEVNKEAQAQQLNKHGVSGGTFSADEAQVIITSLLLYKRHSNDKTVGCKIADILLPKLADIVLEYYR